jgi:hypothetical protein
MRFDINRLVVGRPLEVGFIDTSNMNIVIVFFDIYGVWQPTIDSKFRFVNEICTSDIRFSGYCSSSKVDYVSKDYILVDNLILLRHEFRLQ